MWRNAERSWTCCKRTPLRLVHQTQRSVSHHERSVFSSLDNIIDNMVSISQRTINRLTGVQSSHMMYIYIYILTEIIITSICRLSSSWSSTPPANRLRRSASASRRSHATDTARYYADLPDGSSCGYLMHAWLDAGGCDIFSGRGGHNCAY